MTKEYTHIKPMLRRLVMAMFMAVCGLAAYAFNEDFYAKESVLASGRWVKVSVTESGVYRLTDATLRSMGFSDPSKVNVYGYGGKRIAERLTAANYVDDLPVVQTLRTKGAIIFYAEGVTEWTSASATGKYVQKHNPFSTSGYYYLSDRDATPREVKDALDVPADNPATTFIESVYHEQELVNLGETGHILVGESFLYTSSQSFSFELTDRVPDTDAWVQCSFVTKSADRTYVYLSANGKRIESFDNDYTPACLEDHGHYKELRFSRDFSFQGNSLKLGVTINPLGTLSAAHLNYLTVNYTRALKLPATGMLPFRLNVVSATLAGAGSDTHIWDVTNPLKIISMPAKSDASGATWRNPNAGLRNYVAFKESASLPEPKYEGVVANQNLHGMETPDMVIFTPGAWKSEAQRLADRRATTGDKLNVAVIDQDLVFNEFSSGSRDVQAFRKMLKMLYDRKGERTLRYALFMGRGTFDNRQLTPTVKALNYPMMPIWQSDGGESDTHSYNTDDIFAFLEDNQGDAQGSAVFSIAVGRLPVTSVSDARQAVDKIIEYETRMPQSTWRNTVLLIADDDDNGVHMDQTEVMQKNMLGSTGGGDVSYYKLYTDQYDRVGGQYPAARQTMFKTLREGVVWWTYVGHANTTSWTHERLLTYTDINNLYLKHYPIVYAACCDFLRWDSRSISAAEIMWKLQGGGAIAIISANRPSYISDNGVLSRNFGAQVFKYREDGTRPTIGEIMQNVKNAMRNDTNKLRYVLLGDPSMKPIVPDNRVVVTAVNGKSLDEEESPELMARQSVVVEGYVADAQGKPVSDFTGTINSTLYDAEYSVTTKGNGENPKKVVFEQQGSRIFSGNDSVVNGRFRVNISMPSEISNNYRPAALNLYASRANVENSLQGAGVCRDLYVYGIDNNVVDEVAPEIETVYLNHPSFRNGDVVNPSPMLIARISDNRGINMSSAGIGHQMSLLLDGKKNYPNVGEYYTPSATLDAGGDITFPLEDLQPGNHTLRLRVWDTSNNAAEATVDFFVSEDAAPTLYDVYTDANPASVQANFYLSHDRPDANVQVTLSVYDLSGRCVWSTTTTGRSDMYLTSPITWDLTNHAGRRVPRGIYLYRASVTADGTESGTKTKRLAVTG